MHHLHRDNHHPVRRSPRLSLSPPQNPPPKKQSKTSPLALALLHEPISQTDDPTPLKVYHPTTQTPSPTKTKTLLLPSNSSASSKKTTRRSPRLLAASIGVTNKQCGSSSTTLLLKLSDSSEKKACQLARSCLDETDYRVKCLRSRKLHLPSSSSAPPKTHGKRKLESERLSDESPVIRRVTRRSPRISGDSSSCTELIAGKGRKSARSSENVPLALPSSSLAGNSSEKTVNGRVTRRSPRFAGDSSSCTELMAGNRVIPATDPENVPLALPCPSVAGTSSGKTVNGRFTRRSPRFSGESLEVKELNEESKKSIAGKRGKSVGNSKNAPLALPWSSPAGNSSQKNVNQEFHLHSPRFSGNSLENKELNGKSEELVTGKRGKTSSNLKKAPLALPCSHRSSPRFSGPESGNNEGSKELKGEIEEKKEKKKEEVVKSPMVEKMGEDMEEKVLRRSPRGLASISLVDDYECEEMKELSSSPKKKKKKATATERREKSKEEEKEEKGMVRKKSENCYFVGEVVPEEEAHQRWGWRYQPQVIL